MKIKLNTILKNIYDEPMKSPRKKVKVKGTGEEISQDLTLKEVVVNSLLAEFPDEKNLPGETKLERYELALKIQKEKTEIDLTSKEVVLIKDLIGKGWSPMISGQCWKLIEP